MDNIIDQCKYEHPKRTRNLASAVRIPVKCLSRKETFKNILAKSGKQSVTDLKKCQFYTEEAIYGGTNLKDIVDHIKLNCCLPANSMVHFASIETHQYSTTRDHQEAFEYVCLVAGEQG